MRVSSILLFCALAPSLLLTKALGLQEAGKVPHQGLLEWLDRDANGAVGRFEGAEAFLFLVAQADDDGDGALSAPELAAFFANEEREEQAELQEIFSELDEDGNGSLVQAELPGEYQALMDVADSDKNGQLGFDEFKDAPFDDPALLFDAEVETFMSQLDRDGDGLVELKALPLGLQRELADLDRNGDGSLTQPEVLASLEEEMRGATFEPRGSEAHMRGTINATTPGRVLELLLMHPEVRTIVMLDVPGSMDDESMLRAARLVRLGGLDTRLPKGATVASGGTDFFQAGVRRSAHPSAQFGVHSWDGFGLQGAELPRDHPEHRKYVDYCSEMGIPESFYWFTLAAAPAEGIHWMTSKELQLYGMLNKKGSELEVQARPKEQ